MVELPPALSRPTAMALDTERCIECGACEDLAPGLLARPERITINPATLEAMAVCPVGAIHWLEGEDPHDHPRHHP
ncbi:MAG: hypothetical protein P8Y02_01230 [Deinococcales bacterium]